MISSLCSFLSADSESAMIINKTSFSYLLQAILVFYLQKHKKKLTKDSHQAMFCKRLMYLLCLHYRSINQLQNKFDHGNNVIEAKQLLNFYMMEKRDLLFVGREIKQGPKISPA